MKIITGIIVFILGAVIIMFLLKMCDESPVVQMDNTRELTRKIGQLELKITKLEAENDSLKKIPPKIDRQIVYRERQIDENIAKDSTKAIVEYRRALQDNDEIPEGTKDLTYREIGIGSKLISRVPKLELKVKTYEEIVFKDEIIISDLKYQIGGYQELNEMQKESTKYYKALYEDEASFWNSNYLWLGIGAVGAGLAVFLAGGLQ